MPPEKASATPATQPAEPWRSFLRDLDERLKGKAELRCLGAFVIAQHYGIGRATSDIDFLSALVESSEDDVERLAGIGSELHKRYRVHVQRVGIVTPPSDYAGRMTRMFPAATWKRLSLFALDATDLALSKVERNSERDRDDFVALVRAGLVDLGALKKRYVEEVRPHLLSKLSWHDKTVELWLEMASAPEE
jgi:hypothetical protein